MRSGAPTAFCNRSCVVAVTGDGRQRRDRPTRGSPEPIHPAIGHGQASSSSPDGGDDLDHRFSIDEICRPFRRSPRPGVADVNDRQLVDRSFIGSPVADRYGPISDTMGAIRGLYRFTSSSAAACVHLRRHVEICCGRSCRRRRAGPRSFARAGARPLSAGDGQICPC